MKARLCFVVLACICSIVNVKPVEAQVLYGSVVGTVEDPSGAIVPNVQVEATNRATGLSRATTSDDTGTFNIPNLQPGTYTLKLTAPGFRTMTREGVLV